MKFFLTIALMLYVCYACHKANPTVTGKVIEHINNAGDPDTNFNKRAQNYRRVPPVMHYADKADRHAGPYGTLYGDNVTGIPGSSWRPLGAADSARKQVH